MSVRTIRVSLALALLLALAGCQGKVQQCNRLIDVCNTQQNQIVQMMSGAAFDDPARLEGLAATLDASNQSIAAVQLKDPQLVSLSTAYRTSISNLAQLCRGVATALRAGNAEAAQTAAQQVQAAATANSTVIDSINTYCHQ